MWLAWPYPFFWISWIKNARTNTFRLILIWNIFQKHELKNYLSGPTKVCIHLFLIARMIPRRADRMYGPIPADPATALFPSEFWMPALITILQIWHELFRNFPFRKSWDHSRRSPRHIIISCHQWVVTADVISDWAIQIAVQRQK